MFPQPIRTFAVAVAAAVVVPAAAFLPCVTLADERPPETRPAAKHLTQAAPAAAVPAEVLGQWKYGSISPLFVKDLNTGMLSTSRAMGSFYTFEADGSFKHYVLISFNNSGWKNGTWTEAYGTANFDPKAGTVTLTVTSGKYKVMDNRVERNNYERPMTEAEAKKQSATLPYKVVKDENGKVRFDLGHGNGEGSTAYERWEEKAK